jgi:hypothetical protein
MICVKCPVIWLASLSLSLSLPLLSNRFQATDLRLLLKAILTCLGTGCIESKIRSLLLN